MSEENKVTTETVSEGTTTETTQDSSNDGLIAESKKYRKRAQEAEARLSALEKKVDSAKQAELKKKEEWKTLYEEKAQEVESLSANAEKWNSYEENRKSSLLEKHPEDEREKLSSLDLDTLEYLTEKINNVKPNAPEVIGRTNSESVSLDEVWDMDSKKRQNNWKDIVAQYRKK
jgi:uncharacterized membrane protein